MGKESEGRVWLPLGSVVVLNGGNVPILIIGRKVKASSDEKMWDYVGVPYPEGYFDPEHMLLFDSHQVVGLFFVGFETPRDTVFQRYLNEHDFDQLKEVWPPAGYESPLLDIVAIDAGTED